MSIDTYAKLQTEILDTLDRDDLVADVTQYTPGPIEGAVKRAISKAELRIVRRIKAKEFEQSTAITTSPGVETIALPADFVMMKTISPDGTNSAPLTQKDLSTLYNDSPSTVPGTSTAYAPFGSNLRLRPIPATARVLNTFYYARPTPLSDTNTSNSILANYPDLLHYASILELLPHMENDDRIQVYKGLFDEAVKDITNDTTLNRWSGVPIRSAVDIRSVI